MSTLARRLAYRRPARKRRKYRNYTLSRSFTFGPGVAAPLGGWLYLGEPLHWAGLAVMTAAGLVVIPAAVVFILFCLPAVIIGGPFRQWRISHRRRHGREHCKSAVITASLRRVTFAMDRNRCLYCGITAAELAMLPQRQGRDGIWRKRCLHVDHGKPWIAGFLTTLLNLGLLCDEHNEIKSCYYRERNGYIWYHAGSRTPARLREAADITRVVLRRRWSIFRLLRAAWALG